MDRKNKPFQNLLAVVVLGLILVGAYHVVVEWLLSPISAALEYLSSLRFENKVLLVILVLGLFAIWSSRTRKP